MSRRADGEGGYVARGDRWRYQILVNGRRVSGSGRTQAEAKRAALRRAKQLTQSPPTGRTLADLYEAWRALDPGAVGLRPTTRDQYVALLRAHVLPALGATGLARLDRRALGDTIRAVPGSGSTRRSTYAALVKLADHAVTTGELTDNPARAVPRPPTPQPRPRGLDAAGARAILAAAHGHRYEVAAWLSLACGLRRGEILALRWSDVDQHTRTLHITGSLSRSSAGLIRGAPKTRRGQRQVPLPDPVLDALHRRANQQATERQAAGSAWVGYGFILSNEIGGAVEPRTLSRVWQAWARTAGVTDTGTHAGRHFAASTLLASGRASVADVAAQLGHDPAVLLNTYAIAVADGQRAAADDLARTLLSNPDPIAPSIAPSDEEGTVPEPGNGP